MNATHALIGVIWLPALVVGLICLYCGVRHFFGISARLFEYPEHIEEPYSEDVE